MLGENIAETQLPQAQSNWFAFHFSTLATAHWKLVTTLDEENIEQNLKYLQATKHWHDKAVVWQATQGRKQEIFDDAQLAIAQVHRVYSLLLMPPSVYDNPLDEIIPMLQQAQAVLGDHRITIQMDNQQKITTVQELIETCINSEEDITKTMSDVTLRNYLQLLFDTAACVYKYINLLDSKLPDASDAMSDLSPSPSPIPMNRTPTQGVYLNTPISAKSLTPIASDSFCYGNNPGRATPTTASVSPYQRREALVAFATTVNQAIGECFKTVYNRAREKANRQEDKEVATLAFLTWKAYQPRHRSHHQKNTFFNLNSTGEDETTTPLPIYNEEFSTKDIQLYFERFCTLATPPGISKKKQEELLDLMRELYDVPESVQEESSLGTEDSNYNESCKQTIASIPQVAEEVSKNTIDTLVAVAEIIPQSEKDREIQHAILDIADRFQTATTEEDRISIQKAKEKLKIPSSLPIQGVVGLLVGIFLAFIGDNLLFKPESQSSPAPHDEEGEEKEEEAPHQEEEK